MRYEPSHQGEVAVGAELQGLSSADARRLLAEVGPNRWVKRRRFGRLRDSIKLLLDPMAIMLAVAAAIYFVLGETTDAIVLALALIPVLGVDVALEARSRAALEKLARATEPLADVVRDGNVTAVPVEAIVPGDLLVVREGQVLPADGVFESALHVSIDESSLTGESDPRPKHAPPTALETAPEDSRFFAGSRMLTGDGLGRVTATGTTTQYGGIAALVESTASSGSPLQEQVARLAGRLGLIAVMIAIALAALSLARGEPWAQAVLGAVSLAMAAIPEEFPVVLTLFLSAGAWRLASHGVLVRHLSSVETLGSTTDICTDKTGTLTRGEFQMTEHLALEPGLSEHDLLEAAVLACERRPTDAMERAIWAYAESRGILPTRITEQWELVRDYDFDAAGKHMSHVWRQRDHRNVCIVAAKGAVEGVLAHCRPDVRTRERVLLANQRLAARGFRVLGVAAKRGAQPGTSREDDERDLVLYGVIGFEDPMRAEVPVAVQQCQRAGIRIKLITGDHALTAHAIAEAAGILHDDDAIVTGDELAALSGEARAARIQRAAIFARITPQQKHLIVSELKQHGAVVAMTGDGVNDAAALHRADIGIAMGRRGTDVARATADLILLDDNFASIVETVRQGRHIFQNIQRAFLYLIAFHIPIIGLAILAPLTGTPLLLLPIHLVWLELIVHPVSALVFQAEAAAAGIMLLPPRNPAAPLLPRAAVTRSAASGVTLALVTFGLYWWYLPRLGEPESRAIAFIALISGYELLTFAERLALPGLPVAPLPRTWLFWTVWLATALSLVVILLAPAATQLFRMQAPGVGHAAIGVAAGASSIAWRLIIWPRPEAERALRKPGIFSRALGFFQR